MKLILPDTLINGAFPEPIDLLFLQPDGETVVTKKVPDTETLERLQAKGFILLPEAPAKLEPEVEDEEVFTDLDDRLYEITLSEVEVPDVVDEPEPEPEPKKKRKAQGDG